MVNLHPLLISVIQTSHSRSRPARGFCLRTNNGQDKKRQFLFTSSTYYSLQEHLKPCPSLVVLQTCPPPLLPQNMHIRRSHSSRQELSCALDLETNGSTCIPWYRKKDNWSSRIWVLPHHAQRPWSPGNCTYKKRQSHARSQMAIQVTR